jgi:hypothetical protein
VSIAAMNWVWEHSPTSGNERLVLLAIADCADDSGGNAWPSVGKLASKARLDPRTVQRVIARLEGDGHLIVERGAGRRGTNVYHVVIHSPQQDPRQTATPAERQGAAPVPGEGVAQLRQGRGGTAAPPEPPVPPVPPPPARETGERPPVDTPAVGGGGEPPDQPEAVRDFFHYLSPGWPLSQSQRHRLSPAITAAVALGWPPDKLAQHVGANIDGVRNAYAVLTVRLAELPGPPTAVVWRARPAWCGRCAPETRRIEHPDGTDGGRCPICHPLATAQIA